MKLSHNTRSTVESALSPLSAQTWKLELIVYLEVPNPIEKNTNRQTSNCFKQFIDICTYMKLFTWRFSVGTKCYPVQNV